MCKEKIEKAAKQAGAVNALWNEDNGQLKVSYQAKKTSLIKIQQAIAKVGYDTQDFTASDAAYNKLHGCCQYTRKAETTTTIAKEEVPAIDVKEEVKPETGVAPVQVSPFSALLTEYLNIKNALVNSNAATAAAKASGFVKVVSDIDIKNLSEEGHNAFMPLQEKLASDAKQISASEDLAKQREHFATLSGNFYKLAKAVKLSTQPIYQQYCPMKKTYWLSGEAVIKNPYYGNQMLTCGKVTETL